jgi:ADP-heptose:LPS heptosyltransferase
MALSSFDRLIWRSTRQLYAFSRRFAVLVSGGAKEAPLRPDRIRRILLVRTDKIGDAVVSTPVFTALRQRFPDAEIDLLLGRKNGAAAPLLGDLSNIYFANKKLGKILSILALLRARRYDVAIDMLTGDSMTAAAYTAFSRAKVKIGFDDTEKPIYSIPVQRPSHFEHQIPYLLRLLVPLGIQVPRDNIRQTIVLPPSAIENAKLKIPDDTDVRTRVMINISGSSALKFWGVENYARLAGDLESPAYRVLLVSAPSDVGTLKQIAAASGAAYVEPSPSLVDFAGILSRADVVITPDTSVVHIAAALNKPVVALAGSQLVCEEWHAWGVPHRSVCCDGGIPDIPYNAVFSAVQSLMSDVSNSSSREAGKRHQGVS